MFLLETLLWLLVGLIAYTYAFFPLGTITLARRKPPRQYPSPAQLPTVEVIIAAYNEEALLEQCVRSLLASAYLPERLTICVGSDGSTDQTNAILEQLAVEAPQLRARIFPTRRGKQHVLNDLAHESTAEILVLADADVTFTPTTVAELVKPFADPAIGLVAGRLVRRARTQRSIEPVEQTYSSLETKLKHAESVLWSLVMGADGACYAIRRELFCPVPPSHAVDDFFISMNVLANGWKAAFQWDAVCSCDIASSAAEEFRRKVRIARGNWQNLRHYWRLLRNPFSRVGFCFYSHKLLRWLGPILLLGAFGSAVALALESAFYRIVAAVFGVVLLLPVGIERLSRIPGLNYAAHFVYMNYALLLGMVQYACGVNSGIWQPPARHSPPQAGSASST